MRSNEQDNRNPWPVILDVEGLELNQRDQERISHPLTGGVILFGRNFTSRSQLIKLTNQIMAVRKDVLICNTTNVEDENYNDWWVDYREINVL